MGAFLSTKNEALDMFIPFCKIVQNENGYSISSIRNDHGKEFENLGLDAFCGEMELAITSLLLKLLNKMRKLKGKIEPWKKWLKQCFVKTTYQNIFGLKPLTLHAISLKDHD